MRTIRQIAANHDSLCALCDDATVWEFGDDKWTRLPDIPQSGLKKRVPRDYPDPFVEVGVKETTEPVPTLKPPEEGQTD